MNFHLAVIVSAFLAFTSYQPTFASANNFTAKEIRSGDNLIKILREHGFSTKEREAVIGSHKGLRNIFLTLDMKYLARKSGNDIELRIHDSQTNKSFKITKTKDRVLASTYKPQFTTRLHKVEGRVYGSLLGSILSKIKSNWVASRFMDAYVFDMKNSRDVSRGAKFWLIVEKQFEAGHFIKYGEVTKTSLEIRGNPVEKKFVRYKKGGVFFSSRDLLEDRPLYAPVEYLKIASRFKPNRVHPITGKRQAHLGVDFELPTGDPVFASHSGKVLRHGYNRAAGNYVVIRHRNGMESYYNHLHRIDSKIRKGMNIQAGQIVGEIGCTGYCTRPHLHFAIKRKGQMVDPLKYIKSFPPQMERTLESKIARN